MLVSLVMQTKWTKIYISHTDLGKYSMEIKIGFQGRVCVQNTSKDTYKPLEAAVPCRGAWVAQGRLKDQESL